MLRRTTAALVVLLVLSGCGKTEDKAQIETFDSQGVEDAVVLAAASDAMVEMLGYDYRSFDEESDVAEKYLSAAYLPTYLGTLDSVEQNATAQRVVVKATVARVGICGGNGGAIRVLVFVDQVVTRAGGPEQPPIRNVVDLSMVEDGTRWVVDDLVIGGPCAVSENGPERNSALTAAREHVAGASTSADDVAAAVVSIDSESATVIVSAQQREVRTRSELRLVRDDGEWTVESSEDL